MSAQLPWSSSLIKPSEINSLMEAELFYLELEQSGREAVPIIFRSECVRG